MIQGPRATGLPFLLEQLFFGPQLFLTFPTRAPNGPPQQILIQGPRLRQATPLITMYIHNVGTY